MKFEFPNEALLALSEKLNPVATESLDSAHQGRVLASSVTADRDSPAADVSAMDGYAIRMTQASQPKTLPILGESAAGSPRSRNAVRWRFKDIHWCDCAARL